ncbi:hypothetical protein PHSY_002863 [Pseudozyma hubeiensis SY62]|uniref:Uncharacterized protein n=1 Tax=Pseudozyma hubeiensis (strain SY62) TaxID=1305764 RepID=R9P1V0_PSEHS|nr:hypothetical protein PHSY_002863 [Pseudozyma hubeiensis SY62]GAC95288.1 hypothetical protein PHSY_002863 [Pseudozyma hubeiensis SY62]
MLASPAQPPRSSSTANLGILRRTETEDARRSLDGISKAAEDTFDSISPAAPRPRLHFVEPQKEIIPHNRIATGQGNATASTVQPVYPVTATPAADTAAAVPPQTTTSDEPAPRKRSLVIQEHAHVIERAAERAARQASNLSSQDLEQNGHTSAMPKARQLSASSAGEETASTRSSWAPRSNSRSSSIGTSPGVVSEDNDDNEPEASLVGSPKPFELPPIVPIFSNATSNGQVESRLPSAPASSSRKLTFISPAPSKRRRSPSANPFSPTRPAPDRNTGHGSKNARAVSDGDEQAPSDAASRRVLAFAACPKPERAVRLSPAHAMRKPKSKLSASPAPHKLAYSQRLRGIRGADPIRSPAPERENVSSDQAALWDQLREDVSSQGSGYSEDEEDGDTDSSDDDQDEGLSGSDYSDVQSETQSLLDQSQESAASLNGGVSPSSEEEVEQLRPETSDVVPQTRRPSDRHIWRHEARAVPSESETGSSHLDSRRPSSSSTGLQNAAQNPNWISSGSPSRPSQPSQSQQTSPMSGPSSSSARKLKLKDSFSHPMCFLPDAFEDSAPPTPTEPDSDAYEPPQRSNLLPGWLSEGGSATSSRRASWQQQQQQPPASPRMRSGDEAGMAVPITLPPFRRSRERTATFGVTSDGEQNSRSLGGNAAFIRESAGLGKSVVGDEERRDVRSAGASPYASPMSHDLGISVPINGRPSQPVSWRHLSSQHIPKPDRSAFGATALRRASHSTEPRKVSSAVSSPIGSYSHAYASGRLTPMLHGAAGSERPVRPPAGKQRAVSSSSHIRSRPIVAQSMHDDVVVATSPPRDDASTQLKHHLAHSPQSPSGSTTPGWMSDGQLPSQTTSRYWTERLSSLAQTMSEELTMVGNAVLGKDVMGAQAGEGGEVHRQPTSVPLDGAVIVTGEEVEGQHANQAAALPPVTATTAAYARRGSASIPVPTRPNPAAEAWSGQRDGQTRLPQRSRSRQQGARDATLDAGGRDGEGSSTDDTKPFQFAKKEMGEDGLTRLVVIHTSDTTQLRE